VIGVRAIADDAFSAAISTLLENNDENRSTKDL
jgi:hypothetical protein